MSKQRTLTDEERIAKEREFYKQFGSSAEEVAAIRAEDPTAIHAFITRKRGFFVYMINSFMDYVKINGLDRSASFDDYMQQLYIDLPLIIKPSCTYFTRNLRCLWLRWCAYGGYRYFHDNHMNPIDKEPREVFPCCVFYEAYENEDGDSLADRILPPDEETPETLYMQAYETRIMSAAEVVEALSDLLTPRQGYFLQHYLDGSSSTLNADERQTYKTYINRIIDKLKINFQLVLQRLREHGAEIPAAYAGALPVDIEKLAERQDKRRAYKQAYNERNREKVLELQRLRRARKRAAQRGGVAL